MRLHTSFGRLRQDWRPLARPGLPARRKTRGGGVGLRPYHSPLVTRCFGEWVFSMVVSVSSGPWVWTGGGYHFRAVTVATQGFVALHIQKIELDPESEAIEVIKTLPIELTAVGPAVYEIDAIDWSSPSAFRFRANSTLYAIRDLDGKPEISLAGPSR